MKKNYILTIMAVVVVVIITISLVVTPKPMEKTDMVECTDKKTLKDLDDFQAGRYNGQLKDGLPICLWKDTPEQPADFDQVITLMQIGQVKTEDYCTRLGPEYWKQPEFYPNNGGFYSLMRNPIMDEDGTLRRGVYGYGSYISELMANVAPGDSFSTCVFVHTSWYVWTYQSMGLSAEFPEEIGFKQNKFPDGTSIVRQTNASQYFDVVISPDYLLLEPTYPLLHSDWAEKVRLDVKVAENTPPGRYMIVLAPNGEVPTDKDSEWFWKYKTDYVRTTGFYQNILLLGVTVT